MSIQIHEKKASGALVVGKTFLWQEKQRTASGYQREQGDLFRCNFQKAKQTMLAWHTWVLALVLPLVLNVTSVGKLLPLLGTLPHL